jgi:hypothetical protein
MRDAVSEVFGTTIERAKIISPGCNGSAKRNE